MTEIDGKIAVWLFAVGNKNDLERRFGSMVLRNRYDCQQTRSGLTEKTAGERFSLKGRLRESLNKLSLCNKDIACNI